MAGGQRKGRRAREGEEGNMSDQTTLELGKIGHKLGFQEGEGEPIPGKNKRKKTCHTYKRC